MQLPSLFKTYKNRRFNYKPVFYDQTKDELKGRIKKIENEMTITSEGNYSTIITHGFIRRHSRLKTKSRAGANLRLAIITLVLLGIAWYLLYK